MKVLIVEDDEHTRRGLAQVLHSEGYSVLEAENGELALEQFEAQSPDFVCLDIMMPKLNGYDVCRSIRKRNPSTPIIFISAKSEEIDKVLGLELGADDFIVKPFGVKEVVARIRAVTRRFQLAQQGEVISFSIGDLEVYPAELRGRRGDQSFELSLRDVKLLELFYSRRGEVLDRRTIFACCWEEPYLSTSRSVDQHISQLRKRVEIDPKSPRLICTVHGAGYRYNG